LDNSDSQGAKIFKLPVPFRDPLRKNLFLLVQGILERALLLNQLNRIYLQISEKANHKHFLDQALERLGIRYEATEPDLASIPRVGPLVVVANHPFGGVEGLILGSLLLAIRPDVKIMANYVLGRIPEIRDMLLCVDPFDTKESPIRNLKPLRDAIVWLKAGHVLTVFPAGGVSHLNLQERQVSDPRWSDSIARIVRRSGAPVLPVFFEGTNSALFQLAGLVHSRLRTALLPHELLNKSNKSVTVRIGSIVPVKRLDTFPDDERLITYLRMRTYALKHRCPKAASRGPTMLFRRTPRVTPQIIVSGPNENVLAQEVDKLPADQLLLRNGD
jgi:putative hemolysin